MDLAAVIAGAAGSGGVEFQVGTVTSYNAGTIQVAVGDPTATPLTAFYLSSYMPGVGDNVVLIGLKGSWVVLGNYGTVPGQLKVRDNSGNTVAEVGKLDSGNYGLAAVSGGSLVELAALAFGPSTSTVTPTDSITSTSYAAAPTNAGPAVTAAVGGTGKALVMVSATIVGTAPNNAFMSFATSGATTQAASDARCLCAGDNGGTSPFTFSLTRAVLVTGLNAGSNTFTAQYRVSAGSASIFSRDLAVFPY